jgi:hypothetical protein
MGSPGPLRIIEIFNCMEETIPLVLLGDQYPIKDQGPMQIGLLGLRAGCCFDVNLRKSKSYKVGFQVMLRFRIGQHQIDKSTLYDSIISKLWYYTNTK